MRSLMMVFLSLIMAGPCFAQDGLNSMSMGGPPPVRGFFDCEDSDFERFSSRKVDRLDHMRKQRIHEVLKLLDALDYPLIEGDYRSAQGRYDSFISEKVEYYGRLLENLKIDYRKRKCIINQYKIQMLSPALADVEEDARTLNMLLNIKMQREKR